MMFPNLTCTLWYCSDFVQYENFFETRGRVTTKGNNVNKPVSGL